MYTKIAKLIVSIGMCLVAGLVGSVFTFPSVDGWYTTLEKPFFNPPAWIFAPIWTSLYILMGISFYLVWTSAQKKLLRSAQTIFLTQLLLNVLWSIIFFGLKSPGFAFIEIVALLFAILITMQKFSKISKTASYLLLPYIIWVGFALILNLSIVLLN